MILGPGGPLAPFGPLRTRGRRTDLLFEGVTVADELPVPERRRRTLAGPLPLSAPASGRTLGPVVDVIKLFSSSMTNWH